MKTKLFATVLLLSLMAVLPAQQEEAPPQTAVKEEKAAVETDLGQVQIPLPFIHSGKEYPAGVYRMAFTEKDDGVFFLVRNRKKELLFEELAAVKPNSVTGKQFRFHLKKGMLKGKEYFWVRVEKPDRFVMAFFLIKK